jgi:MarR family transcriptional regulator, negative regulator of the multidrug operon emrRAB
MLHTFKRDSMDRLSNLLTAAATAIADAQAATMARHVDLKPSTTATILTLGQHQALTMTQLAAILDLSHSATVRLVDGLAAKDLVLRMQGRDRREVAVALTAQGQTLHATLRHEQSALLMPLLDGLAAQDRDVLEAVLCRILTALTQGRRSADHICRFCHESICGQDDCPVERQACRLERG